MLDSKAHIICHTAEQLHSMEEGWEHGQVYYGGCGGGASDIRTASGAQSSILAVAGGGGGGNGYSGYTGGNGGAGGGLTGGNGSHGIYFGNRILWLWWDSNRRRSRWQPLWR